MRHSHRLVPPITAIAAFFLASAGVRALLPPTRGYGFRAKLEHLREHADEYDVLFLGSSLVDYGIVPEVFDACLASRGIEVRSFNLGLVGMLSFETDEMLDDVLALEPARLRAVVVEWPEWNAGFPERASVKNARNIRWHDVRRTWLALRSLACSPGPVGGRLDDARTHLTLFCARLANYGQAVTLLQEAYGEPPYPVPRTVERGGYGAGGAIDDPAEAARAPRERAVRALLANLSRLEAANRREEPGEPCEEQALREQVARLSARGVRAVYFVPPAANVRPQAVHMAHGADPPVLLFNRPSAYPTLFTPEARRDHVHLSEAGAVEFSRLLAEELAPILATP